MAKSIPALPLEQVYPAPAAGININSCGDPDCGNHGLSPNWAFHRFTGGAQAIWLQEARLADPSVAAGRGRYVVDGGDKALGRVSDVFEYAGDPHAWTDVRKLKCQHQRGNGTCDITFVLMSNEHLGAEAERLDPRGSRKCRSIMTAQAPAVRTMRVYASFASVSSP